MAESSCAAGRVWVSVRLDMEVPGAILLRDTETGAVFALRLTACHRYQCSNA